MLGRHGEAGRSGLQVQPGVALPFHDQKSYEKWHSRKEAVARGGRRATATIQSISDVGTFDGRFVRVVAARLEPDGAAPFDTSTVVVEAAATSPLPVGGTILAFYDPRDQATVAFLISSPVVINIGGGGDLGQLFGQGQPTARWRVPSHCPECGAPVDTAAACMAAHPMCDHCRLALPVEPPS